MGVKGIEDLRVRRRHLFLGWMGWEIYTTFIRHLYGTAEDDRILRRHSAVPRLSWGPVTCFSTKFSENRRA